LSREHSEIIHLVYYQQETIKGVADVLGIPLNTVKTRMFYARRKLSELLEARGIVGATS
jgi:RNA polymerase sigma-70 factor (ECF subfamily)